MPLQEDLPHGNHILSSAFTAHARATVSVVSLWEIAIKTSKGKLRANLNEVSSQIEADSFTVLPIAAYHVLTFSQLPRYHGDPFDRMLVAQALSEPMRLLTHDTALVSYSELVMRV